MNEAKTFKLKENNSIFFKQIFMYVYINEVLKKVNWKLYFRKE